MSHRSELTKNDMAAHRQIPRTSRPFPRQRVEVGAGLEVLSMALDGRRLGSNRGTGYSRSGAGAVRVIEHRITWGTCRADGKVVCTVFCMGCRRVFGRGLSVVEAVELKGRGE